MNMVKHMIVWRFKPNLEDKAVQAERIKAALEGLVGKIDGLKEMKIITAGLPSSSGDLMMDSLFESESALLAYREHPLHIAVADGEVRPFVDARLAFDYEV